MSYQGSHIEVFWRTTGEFSYSSDKLCTLKITSGTFVDGSKTSEEDFIWRHD